MIIKVLTGPKGIGKTTEINKLIKENPGVEVIHFFRDKRGDNRPTIQLIEELEASEIPYILDRCWVEDIVYGPVYNQDARYTIEDIKNSIFGKTEVNIYVVENKHINKLISRIEKRDKVKYTTEQRLQVEHSNMLYRMFYEAYKDDMNLKLNIMDIK